MYDLSNALDAARKLVQREGGSLQGWVFHTELYKQYLELWVRYERRGYANVSQRKVITAEQFKDDPSITWRILLGLVSDILVQAGITKPKKTPITVDRFQDMLTRFILDGIQECGLDPLTGISNADIVALFDEVFRARAELAEANSKKAPPAYYPAEKYPICIHSDGTINGTHIYLDGKRKGFLPKFTFSLNPHQQPPVHVEYEEELLGVGMWGSF